MDKIEKSKYDITLKDVMALDDVIDGCCMVEAFNYLRDTVEIRENGIDYVLEECEKMKDGRCPEEEYYEDINVEIAYEKLKLIQIKNKFLNDYCSSDYETLNIAMSDLMCLKNVLENKTLSDYFYLDTDIIITNHLNSQDFKEIIVAFENHYGEDVYLEPVGIAYYKFQILYHKAKIDELMKKV